MCYSKRRHTGVCTAHRQVSKPHYKYNAVFPKLYNWPSKWVSTFKNTWELPGRSAGATSCWAAGIKKYPLKDLWTGDPTKWSPLLYLCGSWRIGVVPVLRELSQQSALHSVLIVTFQEGWTPGSPGTCMWGGAPPWPEVWCYLTHHGPDTHSLFSVKGWFWGQGHLWSLRLWIWMWITSYWELVSKLDWKTSIREFSHSEAFVRNFCWWQPKENLSSSQLFESLLCLPKYVSLRKIICEQNMGRNAFLHGNILYTILCWNTHVSI